MTIVSSFIPVRVYRLLLWGLVAATFMVGLNSTASAATPPAKAPPNTLFIKHRVDRAGERIMFKLLYDICLQQGRAPMSPTPDWNAMFIDTEEEYFAGNKYAKYTYRINYKIPKTGSCNFISKEHNLAEIEDEKFRYHLNLSDNQGTKYPGPMVVQNAAKARIQQTLQQPGMDQAMLEGYKQLKIPETANALAPTIEGTDTILGQKCEYVKYAITGNTKTCFWAEMHKYPSANSHAIILKMIVPTGKVNNTSEAIAFEINQIIPNDKFTPPANITLQDRSRIRY